MTQWSDDELHYHLGKLTFSHFSISKMVYPFAIEHQLGLSRVVFGRTGYHRYEAGEGEGAKGRHTQKSLPTLRYLPYGVESPSCSSLCCCAAPKRILPINLPISKCIV